MTRVLIEDQDLVSPSISLGKTEKNFLCLLSRNEKESCVVLLLEYVSSKTKRSIDEENFGVFY